MKYLCVQGHTHTALTEAKRCEAPARRTSYTAPAGGHRRVVHVEAEPTDRQRAYITALGGTLPADATREDASRLIGILKSKAAPSPEVPRMQQSRLGIPMPLIEAIREGRFAVSLDATNPNALQFVRLSTIQPMKSGRPRAYVGHIKVQTQHSDDLIDRCRIAPDGQVVMLSNRMTMDRVTELLLAIIADQKSAAIRYGREMEQCCKCGKTLTDERSRWYGIGPECEKKWTDVIDEVDEMLGTWEPGKVPERTRRVSA